MKAIYIGNPVSKSPKTGGDYINFRNYEILNEIFGKENVLKIEISPLGNLNGKSNIYNKIKLLQLVLQGFIGGLTPQKESMICNTLEDENEKFIFIATAQMGRLAYIIKKKFPQMRVVTFFHNVESHYFKELVRLSGKYKSPLLWAAKKNERLAMQYSDKIIVLNKRDNDSLKKLYGRVADLELPTSFKDIENHLEKKNMEKNSRPIKCLFVGSNFFANYEGVSWFIRNVLDKIQVKLYIVGKNTENWREEFINRKNVEIIGTVDDISPFYKNADCLVLPIFSGSGMKTKTAEALMYGKTIFGTAEAFEGYNLDFEAIGGICNTEEEFINKITDWYQKPRYKYNEKARKEFEQKYGFNESVKLMKFLIYQGFIVK